MWKCSNCKFDNDLLTSYCRICNNYKPDWITERFQAEVEIKRDIYLGRIESYEYEYSLVRVNGEIMNSSEELFAKFYNQEKILVKDMDISQLREHRDELAQIAFEAKARLVATDDEGRERKAKSPNKEWLIPADGSQVSSDALNAPKVRQARMNKIEKLKSQLEAAGLDDETIKEMIRNVERKATESNVKAITFTKPTVEIGIVNVEVKKPEEPKEAFNPSSLFGK